MSDPNRKLNHPEAPEAAPHEALRGNFNFDEKACSPEFGEMGCILPTEDLSE